MMAETTRVISNLNDTLPAAPAGYDNVKWQLNRSVTPPNISACVPRADVAGTKYGTILFDGSDEPLRYLGADGDWHNVPSSLPTGGTAGQVLKKNSATNYDVGWADDNEGDGGGEIIGGAYSGADIQPTSPDAMNDEFDGASLNARWTISDVRGSNVSYSSLYPSWVSLKGKSSATDLFKATQVFDPSTDNLSFTAKFCGGPKANYQQMALQLSDTDESDLIFLVFGYTGGLKIGWNKKVAGSWTYNLNQTLFSSPLPEVLYIHIQRIGGTWDMFYGFTGMTWITMTTNETMTNLLGSLCCKAQVVLNPDNGSNVISRLSVDWFRHNWIFLDR
jgi:hypothetical protein